MSTKQERQTRRIELVETHNLALSIHRLKNIRPYDTDAWKRALHHALSMEYVGRGTIEKLRIALELP